MKERTIAAFSSHVARGTVGLRAAALALEALGGHVWSVPTIQLPHHPGHGIPPRIVPDDDAFTALIDGLCRPQWLAELDAVLCGYFATPQQVRTVAQFIQNTRRDHDVLVVVDPVLGDHGRLYIPEPVASAIRDHLLPLADFITPNRFELQWLSGRDAPFERNEEMVEAVADLRKAHRNEKLSAVVTSAFSMMEGGTGSLLVRGARAMLAEHRRHDNVPNGLGDLTAALMTHHLLQDRPDAAALEDTTKSVADILERTLQAGRDELALESNIASLTRPFARVHVRQLLVKRPKAR